MKKEINRVENLLRTDTLPLPKLPFMNPAKVRLNGYSNHNMEAALLENEYMFLKLLLWHVARCGVRFRKNLERKAPLEVWSDYDYNELHIGKEGFGHISYREEGVTLISSVQGRTTIPDVVIPWKYLGEAGDDSSLRMVVEMIEKCWEDTTLTHLFSIWKQDATGRYYESIFSGTFAPFVPFEQSIEKAFQAIIAFAEAMVTFPIDTMVDDSGWARNCRDIQFVSNNTTWIVRCEAIQDAH